MESVKSEFFGIYHHKLDFYCVFIITQKVLQGIVLFDSFEEGLDLPALTIIIGDSQWHQFAVIGKEVKILLTYRVPIANNACLYMRCFIMEVVSQFDVMV